MSIWILSGSDIGYPEKMNQASVVPWVDDGARNFLFWGDAEPEEQDLLLEDATFVAVLKCDIL